MKHLSASFPSTDIASSIPIAAITQVFQEFTEQNHLILNAVGEGIYGVDEQGRATFVNPAAERILGWTAGELLGKHIHSAIHHSHTDGTDYCAQDCPIYAAIAEGAERRIDNDVFWRKDGIAVAVEYTSTPILRQHRQLGAVVIFRDVSERKKAEDEKRETLAQLRSALNEVEQLKQKLELENAYLTDELNQSFNSHIIIGNSAAVAALNQQIHLVAPTLATVLIHGESGTGKELIARAIHAASHRKQRPLVRVNCAAIPHELFESEFFGHVRGAFSGAVSARAGRFEVADGGTLFLDEVGELPLSLQGKLLRVLQDREYERVGDSVTRNVDVRVIAATNRDLKRMVARGEFREDLYFRLNVFPIRSTPLRERIDDLALLVPHFLQKTCQRFQKKMLNITPHHIDVLSRYSWPGNIRELENKIERQVILSQGDTLVLDDMSIASPAPPNTLTSSMVTESDCRTLQYNAIIDALTHCRGKIYGNDGAANRLGLKPTTLASRVKKWNIDKSQWA